MSEKDDGQLFDLEWNQAVADDKEWRLKEGDLEFAAVSAYCILNYTANDTEVCAIDSYGTESEIADWFRPGSARWLVWDACKGALSKGSRVAIKPLRQARCPDLGDVFVFSNDLRCEDCMGCAVGRSTPTAWLSQATGGEVPSPARMSLATAARTSAIQ